MQAAGLNVIVDTPPDFRDQVLTFGVERVDAVLLTHTHADHIFGFDDLRRFCFMQNQRIPVYGSPVTLETMRDKFSYIFADTIWKKSVPQVDFIEMTGSTSIGDLRIEPIEVSHGPMKVFGYIFRHDSRSLGYIPDCSEIDDATAARLQGLDVMALDCLRYKPHPTHLTWDSSLESLSRIGAKQSYLTHVCHDIDHDTAEAALPPDIRVAYDGLTVEW